MSSKYQKAIQAYQFFTNAEREEIVFTIDDIAAASGWKGSTIKAYLSKKWHQFVREEKGGYICNGLQKIPQSSFLDIHSQRAEIKDYMLRPRFGSNVDVLIDKSRESALLAVQVYNNPLVSFRTPGYIVHMIIAYTSLFHAIFERDNVEYWYKNTDGTPQIRDGDMFSWDISECIKKYYKGKILAEIENIKFFIAIRNKIEHRFIPNIDPTLSGYCQSLLLNFETLLVNEFGGFFALGQNLALALQFSVFTPQQQEVLKRIQANEYESIKQFILDYNAKLPDSITQSLQYSFRAFLVPKLGNHAKSADVAIEFVPYDPSKPEEMEKYEKQVAFIKEKQVQVADQGLLKASHVARRVREATGVNFNMSHHTNAWKLYKVRPKARTPVGCQVKYCQYSVPFKEFVYTEQWVEFLTQKVRDPQELERIVSYRDK